MSRRTRVLTGAGIVVMLALLGLVLGVGGVFSASGSSASSANNGKSAQKVAARSKVASGSQQYPFGKPTGGPAVKVPSPPGEPTLAPTIATKTTTRLYGTNPFEEAVSVTQHVWPAALPLNAPGENDNDPDRPWAVTLVTPNDPLTAITAVPLIHFPNDAPILYVNSNGIPKITLNELKRLGDTGISRFNNVDAFLVGAAANSGVENQLKAIGMKYVTVTAGNVPQLADNVDKLYGSIENPDTGVPNMNRTCARGLGNVVLHA